MDEPQSTALGNRFSSAVQAAPTDSRRLACLRALERKVLWLSTWMIHNANHLRPSRDGLKVGGHQASCASLSTIMTALYFDVLRPQDRVAVKPHASPIFHAIQYLLGRQTREKLEQFRARVVRSLIRRAPKTVTRLISRPDRSAWALPSRCSRPWFKIISASSSFCLRTASRAG